LAATFVLVSSNVIGDGTKYQVQKRNLIVPLNSDGFGFKEDLVMSHGGRVAGGLSAVNGQFPWAARLLMSISNVAAVICSGSLISSNFILTARHCIAE
jgi:hypothetical protein